jgi:hypothetical protein
MAGERRAQGSFHGYCRRRSKGMNGEKLDLIDREMPVDNSNGLCSDAGRAKKAEKADG